MKRNRLLAWLFICLALPLCASGRSIDLRGSLLTDIERAEWRYHGERGPDNWGSLSPAFSLCQAGRSQSPIDLKPLRTSRLHLLRFHYRSSPLIIRNDGLNVRLEFSAGGYLRVDNRSYELKELVFRTPGEHRRDGRYADMEIQLLHRSSTGETAMLAVPVTAGIRHNAMLQRIWDYLPMEKGSGSYYRQVGVNPVFFIPSDHRYYRYSGSLTEPPCTEDVTWFVMQKPMEAPQHLIDQLRQLMGENSRPVQTINGRTIHTSR